MRWRGWLSAVAALLAGVALLAAATDGFRTVTSEGARRLSVARSPRPLPSVALEDQDGRALRLDQLTGRLVLVEFIYTRCPTICIAAGDAFANLSRRLGGAIGDQPVALLSISLDPEHDDPAALKSYALAHGADGRSWRVVRPADRDQLDQLLKICEAVVIPDGEGGFIHNAAIYVVDPRGRLASILDFLPTGELIDRLKPWAKDRAPYDWPRSACGPGLHFPSCAAAWRERWSPICCCSCPSSGWPAG